MSERNAAAETLRIAEWLNGNGAGRCLFKKTDSALRGHVVAELRALIAATCYRRALYAPANPSRDRIIRDGVYYIKGVPLSKTAFARDPEFPAVTATLSERFPEMQRFDGSVADGIFYADAENTDEIDDFVTCLPSDTLLAGAADAFTALLHVHGFAKREITAKIGGFIDGSALIVCGSTQSQPLHNFDYVRRNAIVISFVPADVFRGTSPASVWAEVVVPAYLSRGSLALAIRHEPSHSASDAADTAARLRNAMAETVRTLVAARRPAELMIEGGATAFSVLAALDWTAFRVVAEIAPGVVRMQASCGTFVTLKPGSYPWC